MAADLPSHQPAAGVRPGQSHRHETADVCSLVVVVAVALALLLLVVAQRGPDPARAASVAPADAPRLIGPVPPNPSQRVN